MPAPRFRPLEAIFAVLLVAGGATALAGDKLRNDTAKTVGLIVVFLGAIVFGLDMIVQRRAEIGTRYTSSINPTFHVFRAALARLRGGPSSRPPALCSSWPRCHRARLLHPQTASSADTQDCS